ncbi:MAG: MFS transporter [Alphaproteobacteria bacterium]|nr:MFS transporter [Alphaproteobacteria bacterium]
MTEPVTISRASGARLLFLNVGHTVDHLCMLLFPTVVLALEHSWQLSYEELIWVSTVGFVTFAGGAIPAGWLGDRWHREGMMLVFFLGIGSACFLTGFAQNTWQIAIGLGAIGLFASIYHPVGIALVVSGQERMGRVLGVNGVWGNMGVAAAALTAGILTDSIHWRAAFMIPGAFCIAIGVAYGFYLRRAGVMTIAQKIKRDGSQSDYRAAQIRVFIVVLIATACGGLIFGSTTLIMPKALEDGLGALAGNTAAVGGYAALVFAVASLAQLVSGRLVDSKEAKPLLFIIAAGQAVLLGLLALGVTGLPMLAVAIGAMLFVFGQIPLNDTLIARYTDDHWRARIFSIKYLITLSVAALAAPIVAILRGMSGDFISLFVILAVLALVITLAALLLPMMATAGRPHAAGEAEAET